MTSTQIAAAIRTNAERYHRREITHEAFAAEQCRLWRLAETSERKQAMVHRALRGAA